MCKPKHVSISVILDLYSALIALHYNAVGRHLLFKNDIITLKCSIKHLQSLVEGQGFCFIPVIRLIPPFSRQLCDNVAEEVLGRSVFVNWPHLEEARIISVSDGDVK